MRHQVFLRYVCLSETLPKAKPWGDIVHYDLGDAMGPRSTARLSSVSNGADSIVLDDKTLQKLALHFSLFN